MQVQSHNYAAQDKHKKEARLALCIKYIYFYLHCVIY